MVIVPSQSFLDSSHGGGIVETRAMRTEPRASCWICHSIWQLSFVNELWE